MVHRYLFASLTHAQERCVACQGLVLGTLLRLPSLVQLTDYYMLLFFHVGTNDTIKSRPKHIMKDFRSLAAPVRGSGPQ